MQIAEYDPTYRKDVWHSKKADVEMEYVVPGRVLAPEGLE